MPIFIISQMYDTVSFKFQYLLCITTIIQFVKFFPLPRRIMNR